MRRNFAERSWNVLGLALLLLIVFSYSIRYLQQAILGQVVVYTGLLRLALFGAIFFYALAITARESAKNQFQIIAIGYVLIFLLIYNVMMVDFGVFYTAFGFNLFCVPPTLALIFFLNARYFPVRDEISECNLIRLLVIFAIPITLFGIVQYWLDDPILQGDLSMIPRSEFGAAGQAVVRLTELASTHGVRANAIFDSAIDFGHFASLFAVLSFGMALKHRRQPARAASYALSALVFVAGVVSTDTRNMLLYLGCSLAGALLIYAGIGARALIASSLGFVALFYATIYGVIEFAPRYFAGFFDPISLFQRARGVYITVEQFVVNADSPMQVLFGFGYMQSTDFHFLPTTIFDNTALDIYLYAGICGVALFVAILIALFNFAVRQWRETAGVAWLAVASLLIGTPLFSTLNIDLDQPFFQFVFALLVGGAIVPATRSAMPLDQVAPAIDGQVGLRTV